MKIKLFKDKAGEGDCSDPKKIHPALKEYFGYCLKKTAMLYKSGQEEVLRPFKIQAPNMAVLRILIITPSLNQNTIADELGIDKATMVKLIDQLEKMKYVRRTVDPKDRRGKIIDITALGQKKFEEMAKVITEHGENFLSPLTKAERAELHKLLLKLISPS